MRVRLSSIMLPANVARSSQSFRNFGWGNSRALWETLVGRNPKQAVIENLRHFKALAETGEIPQNERAAAWTARDCGRD